MTDRTAALQRCFAATFPGLAEEAIPTASVDSVAEWDSLTSLTLVALLEEEFDVEISELDLPELRSYEDVREYLQRENRLPA
jgi:acyl carrier protein